MLGVVLWSSDRRRTAVIWCEDQQALAYLRDPQAVVSGATWPEAGDIVEVEVTTENDAQGDLRVVTRLDHQPGRMPVAPHLLSSRPPPLWMARSNPDDAGDRPKPQVEGADARPATTPCEDADNPKATTDSLPENSR